MAFRKNNLIYHFEDIGHSFLISAILDGRLIVTKEYSKSEKLRIVGELLYRGFKQI